MSASPHMVSAASREESLAQAQERGKKREITQSKNRYSFCTLRLPGWVPFPASLAKKRGFLLGFLFYLLTVQFHHMGYFWNKAKR